MNSVVHSLPLVQATLLLERCVVLRRKHLHKTSPLLSATEDLTARALCMVRARCSVWPGRNHCS